MTPFPNNLAIIAEGGYKDASPGTVVTGQWVQTETGEIQVEHKEALPCEGPFSPNHPVISKNNFHRLRSPSRQRWLHPSDSPHGQSNALIPSNPLHTPPPAPGTPNPGQVTPPSTSSSHQAPLTVFAVVEDLELALLGAEQGLGELRDGALGGVGAGEEVAGAGLLHHLHSGVTKHLAEAVVAVDDGTVLHLRVGDEELAVCREPGEHQA